MTISFSPRSVFAIAAFVCFGGVACATSSESSGAAGAGANAGSTTGGTSTGGSATGGSGTGDATTGGTSTGGSATGGSGTGGQGQAGTGPDEGPPPLRTFYVSPNGLDTNPGTQTAPWKTAHYAAQVALAGDLVLFMDGVYDETQIFSPVNSGTADAPIVFRSQNKWRAVLSFKGLPHEKVWPKTPYITIRDFEITQDIKHWGPSAPATCGWADDYLVYFDGANSHHVSIIGNKIHKEGYIAIKGYVGSDYILIDGNYIYDSDTLGIDMINSRSVVIRNNMIVDAGLNGAVPTTDSSGNCTGFQPAEGGAMLLKGGIRDYRIYNNYIYRSGATGISPVVRGIFIGGGTGYLWSFDLSGFEAYNSVAYNNVFVSNPPGNISYALNMYGAKNSAFFNNVVIGAKYGIFTTAINDIVNGWKVNPNNDGDRYENNIFYGCTTGSAILDSSDTNRVLDYNDFYNCPNPPTQAHGFSANPLFVNRDSDWRLASGSPMIGAGVTLSLTGYYGDNFAPELATANSCTLNPSSGGATMDWACGRSGPVRAQPWDIGAYVH